MKRLLTAACILCSIGLNVTPTRAQSPKEVLPVSIEEGAVLLHGDWHFKYISGLNEGQDKPFFQPSFEVSAWKTIPVPGHWELHGFAEPEYGSEVKEGLGLYRRTFRVAKAWQNQRVFLRFDGVLYGFTAWINGKPIGQWASGFNPVTFDVTDSLLPGDAENVLAVRVSTRSKGWGFDTMDCWGLSGIFRDVTLFALPDTHLTDYTANTTLNADGSAQLQIEVVANAAAEVSGKLRLPDGNLAKEFRVALQADGRGTTAFRVNDPKLWTAETPFLYRLELELQVGGKTIQRFNDRIGLREVRIENRVLTLNGKPIKLRGINHHDIWPEEGRVSTEELMRHDLELIRKANINFLRTSHYPPHPRLIELCDEMGIYVDCEVPFIHGREHLKDPAYQEDLLTRARATVLRDKHRPSIIFWSVGNENPIRELNLNVGRFLKQLDPSRPITFPTSGGTFASNWQDFPEFVDLYSPHYPHGKLIREYAEKLTRPIVVTEYAHQRGIARAGMGVQNLWDAIYRTPQIAGGAIWLFQDQGILRTAPNMQSVTNGDLMVWLDEHRYYDTHGYSAVDGIVYSDRTPQVDYWQVRKVYSPVQIQERTLPARPGRQEVSFHVENRFDFRSLAGMDLHWSLRKNANTLQSGVVALEAKAQATESITLPLTLPPRPGQDVFILHLQCRDENGHQFYERAIRLDTVPEGARAAALLSSLTPAEPVLELSDSVISVRHPLGRLTLDRRSGQCSLHDANDITLVSALGPHTGRKATITDLGKKREGEITHWQGDLLQEVHGLKTAARKTPAGVLLTVSGSYPRPGAPEEAVQGEYRLLVKTTGAMEVDYTYTPLRAKGVFVETGFALAVPASQTEFRWLGQGPYAGYPGKDRLNDFGLFHLNREDQYFPGNRRDVELAFLTQPSGVGVMLTGTNLTVSVDYREAATIFSHVALLPDDNKPDMKAESIERFSGGFTLLPLSTGWPTALTNWFGQPGHCAEINRRFFHSYDH